MKDNTRIAVAFGSEELRIEQPAGTFAATPASLVSLKAIGTHQQLLSGTGLDWGSGTGILSIAAASIEAVTKVYGLEIIPANVAIARRNARANGVENKTAFFYSDSFLPYEETDRDIVASLKGVVDFVIANPPASDGDDGFDFRRRVLRESREFLSSGGVVFLNISSQYGGQRIENLTADAPGFDHGGVLATTDCVPFDLKRADLLECLHDYVNEERRGGLQYEFVVPGDKPNNLVSAQAALAFFQRTGESPLTKWQTRLMLTSEDHRCRYKRPNAGISLHP